MKDVLWRLKWIAGVNHIATMLRQIRPPTVVRDKTLISLSLAYLLPTTIFRHVVVPRH